MDTPKNPHLAFGRFTWPGAYLQHLRDELPDTVREIGTRIRDNVIHRTTLDAGNTGANADLRFGDMRTVPWYRQAEDDVFPTAAAMWAELERRSGTLLPEARAAEDKLVVTCRHVAILLASALKAKGIPCRVRSGFAGYFPGTPEGRSDDHWINEYRDAASGRWIAVDADGCRNDLAFDPFDLPTGAFEYAADAWLGAREGSIPELRFRNAGGFEGLRVIAWELFYDFHCLHGEEIPYLHMPALIHERFERLTEVELAELDALARRMRDPDGNAQALRETWETRRDYRILKGALL